MPTLKSYGILELFALPVVTRPTSNSQLKPEDAPSSLTTRELHAPDRVDPNFSSEEHVRVQGRNFQVELLGSELTTAHSRFSLFSPSHEQSGFTLTLRLITFIIDWGASKLSCASVCISMVCFMRSYLSCTCICSYAHLLSEIAEHHGHVPFLHLQVIHLI